MTERIGQQLGSYRLVRLLGSGGFADVYLGEHILLGPQALAAIKVLHSGSMTRKERDSFLNEALTIAPLLHPNIVRLLDFGFESESLFLVMDYAPGGTLRQKYPRGGARPDPQEILNYTRQVAEALQYAHDRFIVHRDVKPENMLFGRDGKVLLSDFGIARAQSAQTLTGVGIEGTPNYMAPEQIEKNKPRPASDQYALGIVVYEWLTGRIPFQGSSVLDIVLQHINVPPPSMHTLAPGIPDMVEKVVFRALAKHPEQRFRSMKDFVEALEQAMHTNYSWFTYKRPPSSDNPAASDISEWPTVSVHPPEQTIYGSKLPSILRTWSAPPYSPAEPQVIRQPDPEGEVDIRPDQTIAAWPVQPVESGENPGLFAEDEDFISPETFATTRGAPSDEKALSQLPGEVGTLFPPVEPSQVVVPSEQADAFSPTVPADSTDVRQHVQELLSRQKSQEHSRGVAEPGSEFVVPPSNVDYVSLDGSISYESLAAPPAQTEAFTYAPSEVKVDFFISYAKADSLYAHRMAHYLRQAGYSVHLPPVDFREGFIFRNEMRKAFGRGRQMITILSPTYFAALKSRTGGWGAFKRAVRELTGTFFPLVVVMHEEIRLGLLGLENYIDLVDLSAEVQRAKLLAYVTGAGMEPLPESDAWQDAPTVPPPAPQPAVPSPHQLAYASGTTSQQAQPVANGLTVFFSYAHKDEKLRKELEKHLSGLRQKHAINGWHYGKINAGSEWKKEIDTHLSQANIVLLLVSVDFINSEYCYKEEMMRAMERHEAGTARVIPILMRTVHWHNQPFSKLQVLPEGAKAVTSWKDQDAALTNVAIGIERIVDELLTRQFASDMTTIEQPAPPENLASGE